MQNEIFEYGLIVGRFQHIHKGHQKLISIGLKLCKKVLIFVGSANQKPSIRNPYDYEYRKSLIEKVFEKEVKEGRIIIAPLNDFEDPSELSTKWGEYVIASAKEVLGENPNCIIYGKDKDIFKCFSKETVKSLSEVYVDRNALLISATKMREFLIEDNKEAWLEYADESIQDRYVELREKLLNVYCK